MLAGFRIPAVTRISMWNDGGLVVFDGKWSENKVYNPRFYTQNTVDQSSIQDCNLGSSGYVAALLDTFLSLYPLVPENT